MHTLENLQTGKLRYGRTSRYTAYMRNHDASGVDAANVHLKRVRDEIDWLTPAGRRLLRCLHSLMFRTNGEPVRRHEIARVLRRPGGLCPHDIDLLKRLSRAGLIHVKRQALPKSSLNNFGRGSEFIYWIDFETGHCIAKVFERERAADQSQSA